jgi:transposase
MIRGARGQVARRAQAVVWWLEGQRPAGIARRLGVARQSVVRWCGRFVAGGPDRLVDRPRSGRPSRLDAAGQAHLRGLLEQSDVPDTTGPGGWTTAKLAVRLAQAGWAVSTRTLRRWLPRLDAVWRRGQLAAKGDLQRGAAVRMLAAGLLAAHLAALRAGRRLVVLFEDEADLALLPHAGFSWQLRDRPAAIPTPGQNQKVGLFGSLSLDGDLVVTEAPRKTAVALTAHLDQVVARFPDAELAVVLDNVGIHHAKATAVWTTQHPHVHLLFLPRYSPNDNAQERVWGWFRAEICRNRAFRDLATKCATARTFFADLLPTSLRQRCTPDRLLANLLAEAFTPAATA